MKITTIDNLWLEFQSAGQLVRWLGPALRGTLLKPLKEEICRQPPKLWKTKWKDCKGCPYLGDCLYGDLFEPDLSSQVVNNLDAESVRLLNGRKESPRPVILAPGYPGPDRATLRTAMRFSVRLIGELAVESGDWVLDQVTEVGRQGRLGPDGIRFHLNGDQASVTSVDLTPDMLPMSISGAGGIIPRLGIGLTTPLFLKPAKRASVRSKSSSRTRSQAVRADEHLVVPSFEDFFRASLEIVRAQLTIAGTPPPRLDLRPWTAAARRVPLQEHCFEEFSQSHTQSRHTGDSRSSRSSSHPATWGHRTLKGTFGGGVFQHVPWEFLPWLMWGGLLHVGGERVSGAGGWRVLLNP